MSLNSNSTIFRLIVIYKRILTFVFYSWKFHSWGTKSIIIQPDLLFNPQAIKIGRNVEIRKGARLETRGEHSSLPKIEIGDDTSIHFYFHCGAFESVKIGRRVLIAGHVYISDHDHVYDDPDRAALHAEWSVQPVVIDDEVWIGEGAKILKGVRIGKRSVIGANAVVTRDIPADSVAVGIPARVIKKIVYR